MAGYRRRPSRELRYSVWHERRLIFDNLRLLAFPVIQFLIELPKRLKEDDRRHIIKTRPRQCATPNGRADRELADVLRR
jgi:hypothetical protein